MGVMRSERAGETGRYDRDPDVTVIGTRIRRVSRSKRSRRRARVASGTPKSVENDADSRRCREEFPSRSISSGAHARDGNARTPHLNAEWALSLTCRSSVRRSTHSRSDAARLLLRCVVNSGAGAVTPWYRPRFYFRDACTKGTRFFNGITPSISNYYRRVTRTNPFLAFCLALVWRLETSLTSANNFRRLVAQQLAGLNFFHQTTMAFLEVWLRSRCANTRQVKEDGQGAPPHAAAPNPRHTE